MTGPTSSTRLTTGPAAAALLSAGLGLLALAVANLLSEASKAIEHDLQLLGAMWIPGANGIGPYSGKETVTLLVWLLSWAFLHAILKRREMNLVVAGIVTLVLLGLATTMLWPPVIDLLVK